MTQVSKCLDKAWAFERVPGKMLKGFDEKIINQVRKQRFYLNKGWRKKTY